MSVREPPVSNRYIDLIDKEEKYRKHMTVVARARPTINTTQPEPARRILMAEKKSQDYRRHLMKNMHAHNQLMSNATPQYTRRKKTYNFDWNAMSAKRPVQPDEFADIDLFQNDYDKFKPTAQYKIQNKDLNTSSSESEFEDPSDLSESTGSNDEFDFQPSTHSSNKAISVSSKSSAIKPKVRNETIRIGYASEEKQKDEKLTKLNPLSTSTLKTLTEIKDLDNTNKSGSSRSSSRLSTKSKSSRSEKADSISKSSRSEKADSTLKSSRSEKADSISKSSRSEKADSMSKSSQNKSEATSHNSKLKNSSSGFNYSEKLSDHSNSATKTKTSSSKMSNDDLEDFEKVASSGSAKKSTHSTKDDDENSSNKNDSSLDDSEIDKLANSSSSKDDDDDKKENLDADDKPSSDSDADGFDNFDDFA